MRRAPAPVTSTATASRSSPRDRENPMTARATLVLILCLACPTLAAAQTDTCLSDTTATFNVWLNCRVERVLAATAGPSGTEKQAETPSVSDDSPTLVDNTSASDFVGLGMTLLGL